MMLSSSWKFLMMSLTFLVSCDLVTSHGRLILPPGRSTAWRYGFAVPPNFSDNELNCGGYQNQWEQQGGKCGVCGDPYQGPHPNEAPDGKYAVGVIVAEYQAGGNMSVKVDVTANHKGWHEFRLCINDDTKQKVTQSCFDQHLLHLADTRDTRYFMPDNENRIFDLVLEIPEGIACTACVLQWKWHCGNSWGTNPDGSKGVGKGAQEQFYGCADISISNEKTTMKPDTTTTILDNTTPKHTTTTKPDETTSVLDNTTPELTTTTTKPDTTTSKPDKTTTEMSEVCHGCDEENGETSRRPAKSTPIPDTTTSKPDKTTSKPDTTTSKPDTTTSKPDTITTKPDKTTSKPIMTTTFPDSTKPFSEVCYACKYTDRDYTVKPTQELPSSQSNVITITNRPKHELSCTPTAIWIMIPGMTEWCNNNCNGYTPSCPKTHCRCKQVS